MSSLGAGGAESPFLVNAANALVFGLSMFFSILNVFVTFDLSMDELALPRNLLIRI